MNKYLLTLGLLLLTACRTEIPTMTAAVARPSVDFTRSSMGQTTSYHSTAILRIPQVTQISQALAALKQLQSQTRLEKGNQTFVVHQDQQDPQNILIWEAFDSEAAFQQHLQSAHLQAFLKTNLLAFVQGFVATRKSTPLPVIRQGYFSTALLTLKPGQNLAHAQQAFADLETQTRREPGNKAFVVFSIQAEGQPAFVIWEYFTDEAAFQSHLKSAHLQTFLGLNVVSFQKGYTVQPITKQS